MSQGTIVLEIVEANGLAGRTAGGSCNPYIKIRLGEQKFKTKIIDKNLNPRWKETFKLSGLQDLDQELSLFVFDYERGTKDEFLGMVNFTMNQISRRKEIDGWFALEKENRKI